MIPAVEAKGLVTKLLIDQWNELMELAPKTFLMSFFTKKTSDTKEVSIEVVRGTEKIAVDVLRGTQGNRNQFSKTAEKIFIPPFYSEWFDATTIDRYDAVFGQNVSTVSARVITGYIESALEKLNVLKYKIVRAKELMCSQVFESGIITLQSGDNIDYKRKSGSMVLNDAADYWSENNVDPRVQIREGCNFLRQTGKTTATEFVAILGANAATAIVANPFLDNDKIKTLPLVDLRMPQVNAEGGVYHGTISAGPYRIHLWSYPEYYDDANDVSTPYIDDDYMYLLPSMGTRFVMAYASVPAIIADTQNAEFPAFIRQMETDYYINNYIDPERKAHVFEISSAPVPIPVSVDRIYTRKVTGSEGQGG